MLVFLQGMTIKPLVELLEVKRKKRALPTVSEEIHGKVSRDVFCQEHAAQPSPAGLLDWLPVKQ